LDWEHSKPWIGTVLLNWVKQTFHLKNQFNNAVSSPARPKGGQRPASAVQRDRERERERERNFNKDYINRIMT